MEDQWWEDVVGQTMGLYGLCLINLKWERSSLGLVWWDIVEEMRVGMDIICKY